MIVLDASAVLAVLGNEPGADEVIARSVGGLISTVNLSEILQKSARHGVDPRLVSALIEQAEWGIVSFDDAMALDSAELWALTQAQGLSLADRACLALTRAVNGVAITMDRSWGNLRIPDAEIHVITR